MSKDDNTATASDQRSAADAPTVEGGGEVSTSATGEDTNDSNGATSPPADGSNGETVATVEELTAQLAEARNKADEHWNALLRAKAEEENLRKRAERDVQNAHKFGIERFVSELLPVKDSMELGVAATGDSGVSVEQLREGAELTLKMLATALEKFGVVEVDPQGVAFDPTHHEAMTMQEVEGVASGTVATVVQKGYLLNGRLVRPAKVIVAK